MHALIVVAHHHPRSRTHALAAHIAEGVVRAGHSAETADLAAEGFEPRFGLADHAVHRGQASPPADVLAEQARIDRADTCGGVVLLARGSGWRRMAGSQTWRGFRGV